MAVATFDTLKFANTLKAAGVPAQQAEAQAVAFADVIQVNFKDLATKDDLDRLAKDLKREIQDEAHKLNAKIDTFQAKITGEMTLLKWMFGATFSGVVATVGLVVRLTFFPVH